MSNLIVINRDGQLVTDSRDVAEMLGKRHDHLLADVTKYVEILDSQDFGSQHFFISHTYINSQNKVQPCYLLTRKGCDMVANKMTGQKGVLFTAAYVTRFEEMERHIQKPKSQLEILQMSIGQLVDQERRLNEQEVKIEALEAKHDNISDILSLNTNDWRNKANKIINAIVKKLGGGQYYSEIRAESYDMLEKRANCLLDKRLNNRKSKMALRGSSKTAINKLSKLDVIEEDKKLVSVYVTVIKELAVKYQLNLAEYQVIDSLA